MTFYVLNLMFFKFFCGFFPCPIVGDACFFGKFQLSGSCQLLQDCPSKDSIYVVRYHLCNYEGIQPIVCCLEEASERPTTEVNFSTETKFNTTSKEMISTTSISQGTTPLPPLSKSTSESVFNMTLSPLSTSSSRETNFNMTTSTPLSRSSSESSFTTTTLSPLSTEILDRCKVYSDVMISQMRLSNPSVMKDVLEMCLRTFRALEAYKKIDIRDISRQLYG